MAITFILILLSITVASAARTYMVDDDGFAEFDSISKAITAASSGDTIYIKPGEYSEEVVLDKPLSITPLPGERDAIIINGDGKDTGILITADGCSIQGLTIEGFMSAGIEIDSQGNTIKKTTLLNDRAGLLIKGGLENNIENNEISLCEGGIVLFNEANKNVLKGNIIYNCNYSIMVNLANENQIIENNITTGERGIYFANASLNEIQANLLNGLTYGITLESSNVNIIYGTQIKNTVYGISLLSSDSNVFDSNEISDVSDTGITSVYSKDDRFLNSKITTSQYGIISSRSVNESFTGNQLDNCVFCLIINEGSNQTFKGNTLTSCNSGIEIMNSSSNSINTNSIYNSTYAIIINHSRDNILDSNSIVNSMRGLYVEDLVSMDGYRNDIRESNTIDGVPILYIYGVKNNVITGRDISHLTMASCDGMTIEGNNITNDALLIAGCTNNRITDNNILGGWGLALLSASNNNISSNNASGNSYSGVILIASDDNQIYGNDLKSNRQNGLRLVESNSNEIVSNNISDNGQAGIWFNLSDENRIFENDIISNPIGVFLGSTSSNLLYHNNFISNSVQAEDKGNNTWDMGPELGGNYWSDHSCRTNPCAGIPKLLKGAAIDRYPLSIRDGWMYIEVQTNSDVSNVGNDSIPAV